MCDQSNESYWAVLSCDTVYYAVRLRSLMCDQSRAILHFGKQGMSSCWVCGWNPCTIELTLLNGNFFYIDQILCDQRKLLNSTFLYFLYIMRLVKGFLKLNQSLWKLFTVKVPFGFVVLFTSISQRIIRKSGLVKNQKTKRSPPSWGKPHNIGIPFFSFTICNLIVN